VIAHPYLYLAVLGLFAALALFLSKQKYPVLQYLPPIVLLYFIIMMNNPLIGPLRIQNEPFKMIIEIASMS